MKKFCLIISVLFFAINLYSQEKDSTSNFVFPKYKVVFYQKDEVKKHEVKLSYGINTFPNGMRMEEKDIWKGGFTANYMYRVAKWFWVGGNINWQFPSEMEHYYWREYYASGSYEDFEIAKKNHFLAVAPEFRLSYVNKKWATLYFAFSTGYGIQTGIYKNEYWYWNVTLFGGNWHIGKNQNFFVGGEIGVGFKGVNSIHAGYRF